MNGEEYLPGTSILFPKIEMRQLSSAARLLNDIRGEI
jgi:hypothetical protein